MTTFLDILFIHSLKIVAFRKMDLNVQLGASPVASLGVVTDLVVGLKTEPVGKGLVLLGLLAQDTLNTKGLDGRLQNISFYCPKGSGKA